MRAKTLQILWHERQPIFSVDFEHASACRAAAAGTADAVLGRMATAGGDQHARIWRVLRSHGQPPAMEYLATLSRHSAAVNCVRWCPSGALLATGGDDGAILIWQQSVSGRPDMPALGDANDDDAKETWRVSTLLRGTTVELYDLAWSPNGRYILSACIDNTCRIYDCIHVLTDHQHFVQGVAWDPLSQFIATQSSDRYCRASSAPIADSLAASIESAGTSTALEEKEPDASDKVSALFCNENLTSFFRRLAFSPDGSLLIAPAGIAASKDTPAAPSTKTGQPTAGGLVGDATPSSTQTTNTVYIFGRTQLSGDPLAHLPGHKTPAIAVRFNPLQYRLHQPTLDRGIPPVIRLPYRYIFAVATQDSVVVYDTQHTRPIAVLANMHYTTLTDVAWSACGRVLVMSSSDGFCSMVEFEDGEWGPCTKGLPSAMLSVMLC
ncbi:WD40-repeat-containing domain protein [Entophlyctis helioformis]|nr:WD40-repeat-containing domain protein [Entophlyctis helioformis]